MQTVAVPHTHTRSGQGGRQTREVSQSVDVDVCISRVLAAYVACWPTVHGMKLRQRRPR